MAEFAHTLEPLKHMFELIDMAPEPEERAVAQGLAVWRERRGVDLAPLTFDLFRDAAAAVRASIVIAGALAGRSDFGLSQVSEEADKCLGQARPDHDHSMPAQHRIAARLRSLFTPVLDDGEPVLGHVGKGHGYADPRNMEVLAAPRALENRVTGMFGSLSSGAADD